MLLKKQPIGFYKKSYKFSILKKKMMMLLKYVFYEQFAPTCARILFL